MNMVSCYLDTNVLSIFIRKNISDKTEVQAIVRIVEFWKQGYLNCFVSEEVKKEIERIPHEHKDIDRFQTIYTLLEKTKTFPLKQSFALWGDVLWGEGLWGSGVERIDPMFQKLKTIFDEADAKHIFLCIKNNIPYFITYDLHSILNRARQQKNYLSGIGIKIVSPKEFEDNLY